MLASLSKSFDTDINDIQHNILETINDAKSEETNNNFKTTTAAIDGLKTQTVIENPETINAHKLVKPDPVNDTINVALDLKQMVDIFNTNENENEKDDVEEDAEEEEEEKGDVKELNNKKKKKKKKKKT
jgi:hypothetical protein